MRAYTKVARSGSSTENVSSRGSSATISGSHGGNPGRPLWRPQATARTALQTPPSSRRHKVFPLCPTT
eukprot:4222802-Prymnesium_polylepis.1